MTWMNIPFPPRLAFGIECDAAWEDTIATTQSGWESRNLNWSDARHNYNAGFVIRTVADYQEVRAHFHQARGRVHSWPLLDPLDHDVTIAQGVVVAGDESDSGSFQLTKRYGTGAFAYDRKITRPFGVKVFKNGILKTLAVDYDLDLDTGVLVMLDTDVLAEDITWSGKFWVPCRYDTKRLPSSITNKSNGELLVESNDIPILEVRE